MLDMSDEGRATLSEMSQDLSQELDRRREHWQRDVDRMQRQFFKDDTREALCSDDPTSAGSTYQFLPDGSRVFRVRIDMHEFSPDELSVRTDRGQLVVSAKQAMKDTGHQRRRQFTKTIDLPEDVDINRLVSRLANDGVLTVEAPAKPPSYSAASRHGTDEQTDVHRPTTSSHMAADRTQKTDTDNVQPGSQIITTHEGIEVLRLMVQLSRADFLPSDVQVVAYDSKLRVVARQEMTSSTGVTSRREFTRELDVTRPVRRDTLRAVMQSDGHVARIWIAAMTVTSSGLVADVEAAVSSVLPCDAQPCVVQLR